MKARHQTDLAPRGKEYGWPSWSADSTAVTFEQGDVSAAEIVRVRVADRRLEPVATTRGVDIVFGNLGPWFGSTPDGWPIVLIDAGTHDIYALDWEAP